MMTVFLTNNRSMPELCLKYNPTDPLVELQSGYAMLAPRLDCYGLRE
jgi:hypothetical protein